MKKETKRKIRFWENRVGMAILVASWLGFMLIIFSAYGDPNYIVTIGINSYGEAHIEMIMFLVSSPFVLTVILNFKKMERRGITYEK